jgi:hypothetical protein
VFLPSYFLARRIRRKVVESGLQGAPYLGVTKAMLPEISRYVANSLIDGAVFRPRVCMVQIKQSKTECMQSIREA